MKGKVIFTSVMAVVVLAAVPALGAYSSIQHNLINSQPDTSFDPNTGLFTISALNQGSLVLNDSPPLAGTASNVAVNLSTQFSQILLSGQAQFVGGSLSLTFSYDADGAGPGLPVPGYDISGPITGMLFEINSTSPTLSTIDGLGRWTATTVNLPGTNVWPVNNIFSSIDSLTVAFGQDLSNFDWTTGITGNVQSQYALTPDDHATPEPASFALLALGALAVGRRRR